MASRCGVKTFCRPRPNDRQGSVKNLLDRDRDVRTSSVSSCITIITVAYQNRSTKRCNYGQHLSGKNTHGDGSEMIWTQTKKVVECFTMITSLFLTNDWICFHVNLLCLKLSPDSQWIISSARKPLHTSNTLDNFHFVLMRVATDLDKSSMNQACMFLVYIGGSIQNWDWNRELSARCSNHYITMQSILDHVWPKVTRFLTEQKWSKLKILLGIFFQQRNVHRSFGKTGKKMSWRSW